MGRNKIRAVDFYCTDKDRKTAYKTRNTPLGGWNVPVKAGDNEKLPRSFRKLQFITGDKKASKKGEQKKGDKRSSQKDKKTSSKKDPKGPQGDNKDDEESTTKAPKIEFKSQMREGESFWAYKSRLNQEKQEVLNSQNSTVGTIHLSNKRKEALKRRKDRKKLKIQEKEERLAEEAKTEFRGAEHIPFGEVADRPPILKNKPKLPAPPPTMAMLAEFLRKKQNSGVDPEAELRKIEALQRHQQMKDRNTEMLRERSQQAYKDAKRRKVDAALPSKKQVLEQSDSDSPD